MYKDLNKIPKSIQKKRRGKERKDRKKRNKKEILA
jgi:hypothetical protein